MLHLITRLARTNFRLKESDPMRDLIEMLRTMRPHNSKAEKKFIAKWIRPLGVEQDSAGNLIKRIGESSVLWSSHTDTVHRHGGEQALSVRNGIVRLHRNSKSNCLGADCTTGVWIMREMILAKVPGLYVFHRGEELGGLGSIHIVRRTPRLLDGIRFAIAFDRMGNDSVITYQCTRTCSDLFARSLAAELNHADMQYKLDDTGTFTDTANYTDLVPECTNISVGYSGQHTAHETQDLLHAMNLRDAMIDLDQTRLVESRVAGDYDDYSWTLPSWSQSKEIDADQSWRSRSYRESMIDLEMLVRDDPGIAAEYMQDHGITAEDFADYIRARL